MASVDVMQHRQPGIEIIHSVSVTKLSAVETKILIRRLEYSMQVS
jgi:hypothetical protein